MHHKTNARSAVLAIAFILPLLLIACTQAQETAQPGSTPAATPTVPVSPPQTSASPSGDLTRLFSHIWRVTAAPSEPAPGSINIFLPNGTLLQTSCVETYLIGEWTVDKARPQILQVSENGQPTYRAEILELTDTTLRLKRQLIPSNETQEVTLTAVENQFTCPDLPR